MNGLQSELLKYKRTLMKKLILLLPLFFALYAIVVRLLMPPDYLGSWKMLVALVFNWWPVLFLPLGLALFATLSAAQEKKAGNYRALRAHDTSAAMLWVRKIVCMAMLSFCTTVILSIVTLCVGLITSSGIPPMRDIFLGSLVCWLGSLALLPIQLWAATWKGIFLSMGIGFAGMLGGVLAAQETVWFAVPWAWATRLMAPIIGVHPNGTLLHPGDPLLNPSVIPLGLVLSLTTFVLLTAVTAFWFQRREVK